MSRRAAPRPGRDGVLVAATLEFARRGVGGTSLQQISDAAGVTKAAVYHHFHSKDDIVRAVLAPALGALDGIIRTVGKEPRGDERVRATVMGLAEQAVTHRHVWSVLLQDPAVSHLFRAGGEHEATFVGLRSLLSGAHPDADRRLAVSIFLSGLMGPALDPSFAELDDHEMRSGIVSAGFRLLT